MKIAIQKDPQYTSLFRGRGTLYTTFSKHKNKFIIAFPKKTPIKKARASFDRLWSKLPKHLKFKGNAKSQQLMIGFSEYYIVTTF